MDKKIIPTIGWADVGSHGGIFATVLCGRRCNQCSGSLKIYETRGGALAAGVGNPVKVKIVNTK